MTGGGPGAATRDEVRLRAVVETAVDGIILIDPRGVVLLFNPACERLFGYRAAEVIGQNVKILMPPPFQAEHDQYLQNYNESGQRKIIGIGREVTGKRKDGSTFPMDLSVGEARAGEDVVFVGVIHDLTKRKQDENTILQVVARLRALVQTAVDGVILISATGEILMFNPACERLFGYSAEEVMGRNVKLLMPPPFQEEHDQYLQNYRDTGERKIIGIGREVVGRRRDGTTFPMDLSVGEAQQADEVIFVGIIHDLSERKRTEEQLVQAQKMETVGQLSGGIAHDFNNLLTVILGNAEALGDRLRARPDLKQLADGILAAGERGAELTRHLLAFSRRQMLQPVPVDCNDLLRDLQRLLQRTLREDIEIALDLSPALVPALADPAQLESAILNLSLNAQDAMPEGGKLTMATALAPLDERYRDRHPEVPPGEYVMLSVTDVGVGMAPDVLDRAFEPFFTTKEVGKGSGLGLSMVYGFVKQSNGHVSLYSEPGLGTTIRLYLPTASGGAALFSEAEAGDATPPPRGQERVLVVEDDAFVRGYAVASLEGLGYHVTVAGTGREALDHIAKAERIDLLFTDIVMPGGMSGWDLAEQAKQIRADIKVLFTSGYPLETLASSGRLPKGAAILNKPYRKAELARQLRQALDSG